MLKINSKTTKKSILFMFDFVIFHLFFIDILHFPSTITYILDVVNSFVFLHLITSKNLNIKIKENRFNFLQFIVLALIVAVIFSSVINLTNPLLTVWACRNNLRYYPYFFACIFYLSIEDYERKMQFLLKIQMINIITCAYQYFILGLKQDNLGGIFGTSTGCNGYLNIYFCIICAFSVVTFLYKKSELKNLIYICSSCMIIAAAAELKVFFVEFAIIVIFSVLLAKPSIRMFSIVGVSVIALLMGIRIFANLYPRWYQTILLEGIFSTGYAGNGGYEIPRFEAFSIINKLFFNDDVILNAFGMGFGNCEYSSFDFFCSDFYNQYGHLNYRWFSHEMWFLECGYIGTIIYLLFFLAIFAWIIKNKKLLGEKVYIGTYAQVFIIIVLINFVYNQTTRNECAYLMYFVLSGVFVCFKECSQKRKLLRSN